ncbi:SET domain-containing protein [Aphelenchoides bicaudatus]|nr:SET domain-containing protein [Aphelenchoides bicaudatus]
MSAYDFTDIGLTEIYLYDLQKNIEYQLTSFGNFSCHSPVFLDTTKNVGDNFVLYFICDDGLQSPGTVTNLFGIEIPRNVSDIINKKPVLIDTYTDPIFNLNTDGVVLSFNKLNDICIARNFDYEFPVESSSLFVMNSKELQDVFQDQLKKAEKSKALNEQAPVPRPSRELDYERLQWQMNSLQMDMQRERNANLMEIQTTVVSGESHTCKLPFDQLKPIYLKEMEVPKIHEERYLVCKVIGMPVSMISINTLVQDLNGDAEILHIYNYSYDIRDTKWLSLGQILNRACVSVQWIKPLHYVSILRRILVFVDPTDQELLKKIGAEKHVSMSDNAEQIKASGNQYFQNKDYESATFLYNRAIRCSPDMAVLYLNKSSSQLRSGYFDGAYESAKTGLDKGGDREKALFRMGLAAYGKRDWKLAVDHFQAVRDEFPANKDVGVELDKATARLAESQTGKYDIKTMYTESKSGKLEFDVADYVGPIEVTDVQGKGKGILATENIKKGTLLSVSKAFAIGYQKDHRGYLMAVNLIRDHADGAANKLQMIRVMEKLRKNPSRAKEVYSLFAGKLPRDENIPEGIIDTARD